MKRAKVYIVEDSAELCQLWERLFVRAGYEVACFTEAHLALEAIRAGASLDILVTDYFLPDMNGANLIKAFRDVADGVPCVLVTGCSRDSLNEEALAMDRVEYLKKPVKFKVLEATVAELLSGPSPTASVSQK